MGVPARSHSGQPPHLNHDQLMAAQAETLDHPRRRYGIAARILFATFDVLYGKQRTTPYDSPLTADYGSFGSLADLFRQIGHDERVHKDDSLRRMRGARFR